MTGRDQHRPPGRPKRLHDEGRGLAGHVVVFEEVAAAGDQVCLDVACPVDHSLERRPQVLAALLRADTIEALARKGPVEMQVSEME